jgi:hypothetical protein
MTKTTAPNGHDFPITTEVAACILSGIAHEGTDGLIGMSALEDHAEHLVAGCDFRNLMADLYAKRIVEIRPTRTFGQLDSLGYQLTETGEDWLAELS